MTGNPTEKRRIYQKNLRKLTKLPKEPENDKELIGNPTENRRKLTKKRRRILKRRRTLNNDEPIELTTEKQLEVPQKNNLPNHRNATSCSYCGSNDDSKETGKKQLTESPKYTATYAPTPTTTEIHRDSY